MKRLLLSVLIFSSPVIAETNNLDKTFLDITMNCRTFRIFDSPDKSENVEKNCIRNKLKENNLSKAQYNNWSKEYWNKQKEAWDNFFNNLKNQEPRSKKTLTESEDKALSALCKIGLNADGGIWSNDDINAAIASIKWGRHWGDTAQATAYKTCNYGGYLD